MGVAALSGPVDPGRLERGLAALAGLGFEPVPAANLASRHGLFAGSDDERLDAFHRLAADPSLTAIFFARGGHGLLRLLPRLDWGLLAAHPRAYVGYSDLTPFLDLVVRRLGLVAFHGPMVAADLARGLSAEEAASLLGALAGEAPEALAIGRWLAPGEAAGVLRGGCLSLLAATLGTPWAPDLAGSVLFLEEINEPGYRFDRMLTQLRLAGALEGVAGIVFGHVDAPAGSPEGGWEEVALDALTGFPGPIAAGLAAGHSAPNLTLPLGLPARLDLAASRLALVWPGRSGSAALL